MTRAQSQHTGQGRWHKQGLRCRQWLGVVSALAALLTPPATAQRASVTTLHPMTVDDFLKVEVVDAAAVDDGGSLVAVVVQRARSAGEPMVSKGLYSANIRADVVVLSAATGQVVMRTHGRSEHAGYWHPVWSPEGDRLAMLGLHGDTLFVCIWRRGNQSVACRRDGRSLDYLTRLSVGATRSGPPSVGGPFLWLSDSVLALALLPPGYLDLPTVRAHRMADSVAATWARQARGEEPTASALDAPRAADTLPPSAEIRLWNVERGTSRTALHVPYFGQGAREAIFSPDRERVAVLADQYHRLSTPTVPFGFHNRTRKLLGVAELTEDTTVWWAPRHPYTRFARWAADGERFGVMVKRSNDEDTVRGTRLFVVDPVRRTVDSVVTDAATEAALRWKEHAGAAAASRRKPAPGDQLLATAPNGAFTIVRRFTSSGTGVWQLPAAGGAPRLLLSLNAHLAHVASATRRLITYTARDGSEQRGIVLLPPGFRPGVRYPLVAWVYPGTLYTDTLDGGWLRAEDDPDLVFLNPNILAGHGYAVLFPSMPFPVPRGAAGDPYRHMLDGITPAIDTLIARGIADSTRLGIIGHSAGGYAVNCVISQSRRFRAAVSVAGIADLTSFALQFEPSSRHTELPAIWLPWAETGQGRMGRPPWRDAARYLRNSPITYTDSVHTPILITIGDNDYMGQAEEWFTALDRAGKRARLVRYWGEGHQIFSPANIRNMWKEIFAWFDENLLAKPSAKPSTRHAG